ncbi:MAG TPA: VOC family protein [Solirubrobacteraceae bacterium]|nr:VOC family protein [Solirubrobacteraceae bacterium]
MIGRLDHVALGVQDLTEAAARWSEQFGLRVRELTEQRALLSCDDEPYCLELLGGVPVGLHHVGWELRRGVGPERFGDPDQQGSAWISDADGNRIELMPHREPVSNLVPHARPVVNPAPGHPRKLGHVNFLTGNLDAQLRFYHETLGMRITDWLGAGGVWLYTGTDHHVMALIDKGAPHFHHLAFDVVDIGQMRMALDHLGRHGRWLGWGPVRHGVGGNIASYVRILEEECFVELYCDMEQLQADHEPRRWPDNRYSSNTWGPLPPRSYFRFDTAAIESERESLEMQGVPLAPAGASEVLS